MEFDLENPHKNSQELHLDLVLSFFLSESGHMPSKDYLRALKAMDFDVSFRRETITLILRVSCNSDPFLSYLAANYLDRFLSSQGIPQPKPWLPRLLAVSCVSLAAKMTKTEFFLTDIQGDGGFILEAQTVQRMEVLILGALKWRMRSITPFSFIHFFISLFKLKDPPCRQALKDRAIDIIFKAQNHIRLLEFKPSIVAASALLSACHELFPLQFMCFTKSISNCSYVNTGNMLKCYNAMQAIAMEGYESVVDTVSSSDTPVNVLDRGLMSSQSEKTNGTIVASNGNTPMPDYNDRDIKRRKLSGYCDNPTAKLSQIYQG